MTGGVCLPRLHHVLLFRSATSFAVLCRDVGLIIVSVLQLSQYTESSVRVRHLVHSLCTCRWVTCGLCSTAYTRSGIACVFISAERTCVFISAERTSSHKVTNVVKRAIAHMLWCVRIGAGYKIALSVDITPVFGPQFLLAWRQVHHSILADTPTTCFLLRCSQTRMCVSQLHRTRLNRLLGISEDVINWVVLHLHFFRLSEKCVQYVFFFFFNGRPIFENGKFQSLPHPSKGAHIRALMTQWKAFTNFGPVCEGHVS